MFSFQSTATTTTTTTNKLNECVIHGNNAPQTMKKNHMTGLNLFIMDLVVNRQNTVVICYMISIDVCMFWATFHINHTKLSLSLFLSINFVTSFYVYFFGFCGCLFAAFFVCMTIDLTLLANMLFGCNKKNKLFCVCV